MKRWVLIVLVGCGSAKDTSKPATPSSNDQFCSEDKARPHARDYPDQAAAEAAGCKVVRVYGSVKDEKTGEMKDNEQWIFCCP